MSAGWSQFCRGVRAAVNRASERSRNQSRKPRSNSSRISSRCGDMRTRPIGSPARRAQPPSKAGTVRQAQSHKRQRRACPFTVTVIALLFTVSLRRGCRSLAFVGKQEVFEVELLVAVARVRGKLLQQLANPRRLDAIVIVFAVTAGNRQGRDWQRT